MIRLERVSKRYGKFEAVRELDLEIKRGELFGAAGHAILNAITSHVEEKAADTTATNGEGAAGDEDAPADDTATGGVGAGAAVGDGADVGVTDVATAGDIATAGTDGS